MPLKYKSLKYVCIGIKIVGAKVMEILKVECCVAAPFCLAMRRFVVVFA
jgi:hypothetical protein